MTLQNTYQIINDVQELAAPVIPEGFEAIISIVRSNQSDKTRDRLLAYQIQSLVCKHFNCEPNIILKKGRKGEIVFVRKVICYLLKIYTGLTLMEIATVAGYGTDHSTTKKAISSLAGWMQAPDIKEQVDEVNNFIIQNINI